MPDASPIFPPPAPSPAAPATRATAAVRAESPAPTVPERPEPAAALLRPAPPARTLAVWLPRLPTDRLARRRREAAPEGRSATAASGGAGSAAPLVTVAREKAALRLAAVNAAAAALGLAPGMALADARARHPDLAVAESDPAAERALLAAAADLSDRYTPLVALDPPDGLFLDVTGCAHLFGGEAAMAADLGARLARFGLTARLAVAATPGAAWAVARCGLGGEGGETGRWVLPTGEERTALSALPVAALRLAPAAVGALARAGLTRIGDLAELPRPPLAARFGAGLITRLDQALGRADEALLWRRPPPVHAVERVFAEPIVSERDVLVAAERLAARLAETLAANEEGARGLELTLFRVDGAVHRLAVGTSRPLRDPAVVRRLLAEKLARLDDLDAGYGFDRARLAALAVAPLPPEQAAFEAGLAGLSGDTAAEEELARLVDRLAARLGPDRVTRLVAGDSHLPERAGGAVPVVAAGLAEPPAPALAPRPSAGPARPGALPLQDAPQPTVRQDALQQDTRHPRPARLFVRPEAVEVVAEVPDGPPARFRWRRVEHRVLAAEGPERIAAEWWRDGPAAPTRDYFRVETTEGRRLWLYREGLYGRETAHPGWYVHGLFA
jgi:protein ImuB